MDMAATAIEGLLEDIQNGTGPVGEFTTAISDAWPTISAVFTAVTSAVTIAVGRIAQSMQRLLRRGRPGEATDRVGQLLAAVVDRGAPDVTAPDSGAS